MNTSKDCNFNAESFWLAICFAVIGWLSLIIGIVFLSMAISFERRKRKQWQDNLIFAKINRPRPLVLPVTVTTPVQAPFQAPPVQAPIQAPPVQAPVQAPVNSPAIEKPVANQLMSPTYKVPPTRPTNLPIQDPYLPKPPPLEPLRLNPPPPPVMLQKPLPPYGFTYLPNGVLNENDVINRDSMFNTSQSPPPNSEPWNPTPYRAYSNQAYEN
ncbi:hypothetical protein CHUAL_005355 [Chamberlinius hualienensis]